MTLALLPVLAAQGARLMRRVPDVPEAQGARHGVVGAGSAAGSLSDPASAPFRLLVIGESTAVGVGAPTQRLGLAGQLALALQRRSGRDVQWRVVGRSGFTAAQVRHQLLATLTPRAPRDAVDLAVVVLGVNDTRGLTRPRQWRQHVQAIVRGVQAQTHARSVLFTGVPRMGDFLGLPWPLRDVLDARSRMLDAALGAAVAELAGVDHVPFTVRIPPELFCHDGFHPAPEGYRLWAEFLLDSRDL